ADPRIEAMITRTKSAMAPTPTAVPPTPTAVPAQPTAIPVAMSTQIPDTDLGQRYFGQVTLAVVPGKDSDAPAAMQFFFQDQIGLHIEGLKQHLRLPFTLRVFNADTKELVAEINSDDSRTTAGADAALSPLVAAAKGAAQGSTPPRSALLDPTQVAALSAAAGLNGSAA